MSIPPIADAPYQALSADQRPEALELATRCSERRTYFFVKDVWVVSTLAVLFESPFGRHLAL